MLVEDTQIVMVFVTQLLSNSLVKQSEKIQTVFVCFQLSKMPRNIDHIFNDHVS